MKAWRYWRHGTVLLPLLLLQACVSQPVYEGSESLARVTTRGAFVTVDDSEAKSTREIILPPGQHTLLVRHATYRVIYLCQFEFTASAGSSYEIIYKPNPQPLTLYRWHRSNALWALRLDPVAPTECSEEPRQPG
jgi:hypothetical protein